MELLTILLFKTLLMTESGEESMRLLLYDNCYISIQSLWIDGKIQSKDLRGVNTYCNERALKTISNIKKGVLPK